MGCIWRITMVLLSTLAALVIIVNSAEEEYEAHYRKELRPSLDAVTSRTYEQPWRTVQMDKPMQQSSREDHWTEDRTDQPLRRRKLKRKRQPDSSGQEISKEAFGFHREPIRPYYGLDFNAEMTEAPKRRRKKLDLRRNRWDVTLDGEVPTRRRVQRRKRPFKPDSSEDFSDLYPGLDLPDTPINTERNDDLRHFEDREQTPMDILHESRGLAEDTGRKFALNHDIIDKSNRDAQIDKDSQKRTPADDDFSDITIEELRPETREENLKSKEKIGTLNYGFEKSKENVDPITLKDILKKSNGTSLSEILQQHNLSLTDLLDGKDRVLSILKSEESYVKPPRLAPVSPQPFQNKPFFEFHMDDTEPGYEIKTEDKATPDVAKLEYKESQDIVIKEDRYTQKHSKTEDKRQPEENSFFSDHADNIREINEDTTIDTTVNDEVLTIKPEEITTTDNPVELSSRPNIRRYPTSIRRKQRIRPVFNNTLKSQLSRDMLAMNARKYFNNRRRNSSHEWRELIPLMKKNLTSNDAAKKIGTTPLVTIVEETTTQQDVENCTTYEIEVETEASKKSVPINEVVDKPEKTDLDKELNNLQSAVYKHDSPTTVKTTTEVNVSGLRLQAFNNRLKKKRMRQKNLTTEPPQDDIMINLFGIPNLVSSSEFISQTQAPRTSIDDVTIVEEPLTTQTPRKHNKKTSRYSPIKSASTSQYVIVPTSTEESAQVEIEEILNDSKTSIKLSKILKERNMTLSELVEHRERGSSHVHLADIFHNTSKEPNSPEPFLSKSSIEPISKEIYPLRALLEANTHDTTTKAMDTSTTEVIVPLKMDFRNNVNENDENMGFASLFPFLTNKTNAIVTEKTNLKKDSQGSFYETSIVEVNATDIGNGSESARESRVIQVVSDNSPDEIVSWNDIFTLMGKTHENITEDSQTVPEKNNTTSIVPTNNIGNTDDRFLLDEGAIIEGDKSIKLIEDVNGDGLIVLEDIEKLRDNKFRALSEESLDFGSHENIKKTGILEKPNQTKSVTVATASIAGLAMVLFLLTYVGYRWHQHRSFVRSKSFSEERVPTPVFENRKGHKHNSSSRSISPMLASSNIYTLNILDSRNGKESPDYMWDSLRKPFK